MATRKVVAGFDRIHAVLGAAMRAASKDDWPAKPHRGDGPLPMLSGRAQIVIAHALCGRVRDLVAATDLAPFDEAVAAVRRFLDGKKPPRYAELAELADGLRTRPERRPALEVARNATAATRSLVKGGSTIGDVNKCTALAAASAVAALGGAPDRPLPSLRVLLDWIDGEILAAELIARLAERGLEASSPSVVYRGGASAVAVIVARLDKERFGALAKVGARWAWHVGDRDEALAHVPEAHFAPAAAAIAHG